MSPCSLVDICRSFGGLHTSVLTVDETCTLINRLMFRLHVNFRLHWQDGAKERSFLTPWAVEACWHLLGLNWLSCMVQWGKWVCSGLLTWVRRQIWVLFYIYVLIFCIPSCLLTTSLKRIILSRIYSPSAVSIVLIAKCSALRYNLNFSYDIGKFCYCRYHYCAYIC